MTSELKLWEALKREEEGLPVEFCYQDPRINCGGVWLKLPYDGSDIAELVHNTNPERLKFRIPPEKPKTKKVKYFKHWYIYDIDPDSRLHSSNFTTDSWEDWLSGSIGVMSSYVFIETEEREFEVPT